MLDAHSGQKRALDPLELELELWMAGSHHVTAGNRTLSSSRATSALELLSLVPGIITPWSRALKAVTGRKGSL